MAGEPRRCLACGGKAKPAAGARAVNCPGCGLTLVVAPGRESLAPMVAPRFGREAAFGALSALRRLPDRAGATEIRQARLLLVPFWRHVDEASRSIERRGLVVSAADLLPIGLPSLTPETPSVRGLEVERHTRAGDMMGRLAEEHLDIDAAVVSVTRAPDGGPASMAVPGRESPDGAGWKLVYHPVWAFHYIVYNKEHFHVVDAVSGEPVGPARDVNGAAVGAAAAAAMLLLFAAGLPWLGAASALPAWAGGWAASRIAMRAGRR